MDLPPWPGVAAARGAVVSGCYDQERRNPRQVNSLHTQVTASGSPQISGQTPKTQVLALCTACGMLQLAEPEP